MLPGHELRIVDEHGNEVADRTEGFLWFRGPSATTRLLPQCPARRKSCCRSVRPTSEDEFAWVDSGDRAYRGDGEIYVTGRVKDIIIKGGRNLYPHEVEELAARAEGIRKGCIVAFGMKDEASGTEKLVVVAEVRERDATRRAAIAAAVTRTRVARLGPPARSRGTVAAREAFPRRPAANCAAKKPSNSFSHGTLSAGKAPAWLQIARLGAGSAHAELRPDGSIMARPRPGDALRRCTSV